MSKETFEQEMEEIWGYGANEVFALINEHGGTIRWNLPTPEGAGCTCSDTHREWMVLTSGERVDFDKAGPHHVETCIFCTPF